MPNLVSAVITSLRNWNGSIFMIMVRGNVLEEKQRKSAKTLTLKQTKSSETLTRTQPKTSGTEKLTSLEEKVIRMFHGKTVAPNTKLIFGEYASPDSKYKLALMEYENLRLFMPPSGHQPPSGTQLNPTKSKIIEKLLQN